MTEEISPINSCDGHDTPEKSTSDPSTEQSTTETPTLDPSNASNTPEVVANPDFITWKVPPYCELCNVTFTGESCSELHFNGNNHKNKLQTMKKYQDKESLPTNSKNVLCDICWKEMNTQAMFDIHSKSPAHLDKMKGRLIVQKLKEEYQHLKDVQKTQ